MLTHYYKFTITIADEKQPGMAVKVRDLLRILGITDKVKIECYTKKEETKMKNNETKKNNEANVSTSENMVGPANRLRLALDDAIAHLQKSLEIISDLDIWEGENDAFNIIYDALEEGWSKAKEEYEYSVRKELIMIVEDEQQ